MANIGRSPAVCLGRVDLRGKIGAVREIGISADDLVSALLASGEPVCILTAAASDIGLASLDRWGAAGGIDGNFDGRSGGNTLRLLDEKLSGDNPSIFTLSYGFGAKIQNIGTRSKTAEAEPDVFIATFDALFVHDYVNAPNFCQRQVRQSFRNGTIAGGAI